jgi:hypothetical protein
VEWINLAQHVSQRQAFVNTLLYQRFPFKVEDFSSGRIQVHSQLPLNIFDLATYFAIVPVSSDSLQKESVYSFSEEINT